MKRVNEFQVFELGKALSPLHTIKEGTKLEEMMWELQFARGWVIFFLANNHIPLKLCRKPGEEILKAISKLLPSDFPKTLPPDLEYILTFSDEYDLREGAEKFETVLSAELLDLDTYFVSQKGIYKTPDLLAHAEMHFSEEVRRLLPPKAISDIKEAGRCLAFDLGTAAGFHIARAIESVLLSYLEEIAPTAVESLKDSDRNLGKYINLLKSNGGEPKVCATLDQFKDLHRNPLMHPEVDLTPDEAMALFGIAQSAIVTMVTEIAKPRQQPVSPNVSPVVLAKKP